MRRWSAAAGEDVPYVRRRTASAPGGVRSQVWHFPSRTECMVCHTRASNFVLGPSLVQMNKGDQLARLERLGVLRMNYMDYFNEGTMPIIGPLTPRLAAEAGREEFAARGSADDALAVRSGSPAALVDPFDATADVDLHLTDPICTPTADLPCRKRRRQRPHELGVRRSPGRLQAFRRTAAARGIRAGERPAHCAGPS